MSQSFFGMGKVQRNVSVATLQHAENSGNHRRIMLEQEGNPLLSAVARSQYRLRYLVGCAIELSVGPAIVAGLDGDLIRIDGYDLFEARRK